MKSAKAEKLNRSDLVLSISSELIIPINNTWTGFTYLDGDCIGRLAGDGYAIDERWPLRLVIVRTATVGADEFYVSVDRYGVVGFLIVKYAPKASIVDRWCGRDSQNSDRVSHYQTCSVVPVCWVHVNLGKKKSHWNHVAVKVTYFFIFCFLKCRI